MEKLRLTFKTKQQADSLIIGLVDSGYTVRVVVVKKPGERKTEKEIEFWKQKENIIMEGKQ